MNRKGFLATFLLLVAIVAGYLALRTNNAPDHLSTEPSETVQRVGEASSGPTSNEAGPVESIPSPSIAPGAFTPEELTPPVADNIYSSNPSTPLDTYNRFIDRANAGDEEAMFRVYQALKECNGAPLDADGFRKHILEADPPLPIDVTQYYEKLMLRCQSLYAHLNDPDPRKVMDSWLRKAAEADHPTAKAQFTLSYTLIVDEDDRPIFNKAVENSRDHIPYYLMAEYLRRLNQGETVESAAWELAACNIDANCNPALKEYVFSAQLYPREMEEVRRQASLIEARRFELVGVHADDQVTR